MNIYFTADEFRKQAEGLIGKCVVTGQEVRSTEKSLREDLYKKHMTGEPIACRPNYAVLTRLIRFIGWKRLEMNQSLTFQGVTEETFPSMMRRTLVILLKARFVPADVLAKMSLPGGDAT